MLNSQEFEDDHRWNTENGVRWSNNVPSTVGPTTTTSTSN